MVVKRKKSNWGGMFAGDKPAKFNEAVIFLSFRGIKDDFTYSMNLDRRDFVMKQRKSADIVIDWGD